MKLVEYFEKTFFKEPRVLEVHVISENFCEENAVLKNKRLLQRESVHEISSIEWFKQNLPLYPDYSLSNEQQGSYIYSSTFE